MKISVIIPLYNAEKFFGACLESLLIQTFTDFEVIVVDDCSTDSSATIAESYLKNFGGRMKIITLTENTGNASVPRNVGLEHARGEYVYFMDNDDLLIADALETLYNFAQAYRADVVYMERGFLCGEEFSAENLVVSAWDKTPTPIDEPMFETDELGGRVENFLQTRYGWAPWEKFVRRDFLVADKIFFPPIKISEDVLWTFKVICSAKKILRVPTPLYIHRSPKNSWSRTKRTPHDEIKFWLDPLIKGVDLLDEFTGSLKFFAQNVGYRFEVTNFFVKMQLAGMLGALDNFDNRELYEIIHREFSAGNGKHAALIANLIIFMNFYRNKLNG